MNERRNGEGSADELEAEARRRAEEAQRRWAETETSLRARWDQREAALREESLGTPAEQSLRDQASSQLERARTAQIAHQEAIRERLERLEQLTGELKQSGAVEPRQRIRDRLARWWRGILPQRPTK